MARLQEVSLIYEKLKTEWNRKPPNVEKTSEFLRLLKVDMQILENLIFLSLLRINSPTEDFILLIHAKIHVAYLSHV
jgi:hypothetical protein